jgi:hypothetical protein
MHESFATFDPATSSWRTSQTSLDSPRRRVLRRSSRGPGRARVRRGVGLLSGCRLRRPARPRSRLLTAVADAERDGNGFGLTLPMAISLLPTPVSADGTGSRHEKAAAANGWKRPSGAKATKSLGTILRLLPTPTVDDAHDVTQRAGEFQSLTRTALSIGESLSRRSPGGKRVSARRLSPWFVEWMMGAPGVERSRLSALGDGVLVQAGWLVGRRILEYEGSSAA